MKQTVVLVMPRVYTELETALRRRLALVVEDSNDAVIVQDLDGRILAWNRGAERMYGYSEDEALQMNIAALASGDGRAQALGLLGAVARGDDIGSLEISRVTKDGRRLDVWLTTTVLADDDGRPVGVATTERDIGGHKRALAALRETTEFERRRSELLRELANSIPDPVFVKDEQSRMLFANPATLEAIGKPAEEVLGRSDREFFDDEQTGAAIVENDRRIMATGEVETVEERVESPSGSRWFLSTKAPFRDATGKVTGIIGVTRDITARKRAEDALRESEERFRLLVQGVRDCAIYMLAPDGAVTSWSAAAEQMFGYREEEIVGQHRRILFTDEQRAAGRPERELEEALANGTYESEAWRARKDGSRFWANVLITALRDDAGNVRGFASVHRDFTQRKTTEAALRASEERYRSLFEHMSEGLAYCRMLYDGDRSVDFVYLNVNPAFETLTGLRGVVGKKVSEVIPGIQESDPDLIETYGKVARLGTPARFETYVKSIGQWFDISVYSPARGEFVAVFDVITRRKRAEEALRESEVRFRLALRSAPVSVAAQDRDLRYIWAFNHKTAPPGGVVGRRDDEIFTPEEAARLTTLKRRVLDEGVEMEEGMWLDRPGRRMFLDVSFAPLRDASGQVIGVTCATVDVTELKQAEEALREADRQKNRFLAMLSHELRNPLAPIRNSLYILHHAAPGGEQAMRAKAIIDRQIKHMTWLIDDLLDVTRIAHGKIKLQRERIELNELALRTVEDHRTVFAKSDVRLELLAAPAEVWVDGDRVRLAQVISNLLQNAVKFAPHGGKTTVSVQADSARGQAIVTVRDTGSGIQPEMLPRLFDAFTQADDTLDRSKGGLGLGLALVKGLVEMHGGSVAAASGGRGKGAAFTITLPLHAPAALITQARRDVAVATAPRRVLVIEDNEDAADTLREVLEIDQHVVEVAYTGREGIAKAQAFRPDVVLCDIGLPEMDGYEVARTLRADPVVGGVGLIALSGYAQPEDVELAREAGFDAHLAKPPSIDAIARVVAECGSVRQDEPVECAPGSPSRA